MVQKKMKKNITSSLFSFFFFSVSFIDVMGGNITVNLKELH